MGAALLWTLISMVGLAVSLGVLGDTLWNFARFRQERPDLAVGYRIEVVRDLAISLVQAFFATLGAVALLNLRHDERLIIGLLLFAGPVLLTTASLFHYWSRRRF